MQTETRLATLREGWKPTDYSKRLRVFGDTLLVLSDAHVPYHNERLIASALERLKDAAGERTIVWLGDLLDMPTYSPWGTEDTTTMLRRELALVRGVLEVADEFCVTQYWVAGNHERRFMRRNGFEVGMAQLAGMAGLGELLADGRLVVSDNPTLDYTYDRKRWLLTHPAQYGATPLVVPGKIADQQRRHVVSSHAHHWGMGTSPSGDHTVIETGGLFDPRLIPYVNQQMTTHRAWVSGYLLLDHGVPTLYRN
jgi:predicted phosphodiesterase